MLEQPAATQRFTIVLYWIVLTCAQLAAHSSTYDVAFGHAHQGNIAIMCRKEVYLRNHLLVRIKIIHIIIYQNLGKKKLEVNFFKSLPLMYCNTYRLISHISRARPLDYILIPATGVSTAGIVHVALGNNSTVNCPHTHATQ